MGGPSGTFEILQRTAAADRRQQLFLRGMVNGNLGERDRLLSYTTGEFFTEFSLFLTECELKEREMAKLKKS